MFSRKNQKYKDYHFLICAAMQTVGGTKTNLKDTYIHFKRFLICERQVKLQALGRASLWIGEGLLIDFLEICRDKTQQG